MAREIVRPDPATEQREQARLAARMDQIREYNEQNGGTQVDFRTHVRRTREQYQAKIAEVRDDPRLPDRERYRMLGEIAREMSRAMSTAKREAEEAYAAEVERLDRQANPPPERGKLSTAMLIERRELREDLEKRWSKSPDGILLGYRDALRRGDAMAADLFEERAHEFIPDTARRMEFREEVEARQRAGMSPEHRQHHEALEALKAEEAPLMLGIEHQIKLAGNDARYATSGRPVLNRDTAIGLAKARGINVEGAADG